MKVKKLSEAEAYEAPNHRSCSTMRLIGPEDGAKNFSVGLSHFLPGGGAGPDASPLERTYTILAGELTIVAGGEETVLNRLDTCYIGPGETREIINRGNEVVTMLVAIAAPR